MPGALYKGLSGAATTLTTPSVVLMMLDPMSKLPVISTLVAMTVVALTVVVLTVGAPKLPVAAMSP